MGPSNIVCRENISGTHREELSQKLRKITGWPGLEIDRTGVLRLGAKAPVDGSRKARALLSRAVRGATVVVLEDASRNPEVAFMRVVPGMWKIARNDNASAFVVQIDFTDFDQVMGDEPAVEAFDVGWGLLHELDHVVNNSLDAVGLGKTGECEARINQMRRECNLPQRMDYFYTFSPLTRDTTFSTKLVRLAFEHSQTGKTKKRRYWVVWDASLVGGLVQQKQIAGLR